MVAEEVTVPATWSAVKKSIVPEAAVAPPAVSLMD
jgi:hypothetical protein